MNAKYRFDATLKRCRDLIELFNGDTTGDHNYDLLRAAVVLAVAGLDKYCKDRFLEFFEQYYKKMWNGRRLGKECDAYLKKAGVTKEYLLSLYQRGEDDPLFSPVHEAAKKLKAYLYKSTFQGAESIAELFQCYGLKDIIKNAVDKSQDEEIWLAVAQLIRRRHQIAHTADYGQKTDVQEIGATQVADWLDALEGLVEGIDLILDSRFKKTNARRAVNPASLAKKKPEEFSAEFHKNKGYLDVSELSSLRRIPDIEELFGVKAKRKGFLCEGTVAYPQMGNAEIWWPKISSEPNYAGYKNEPQYDGATNEIVGIVERNVQNQDLNDKTVKAACARNLLRIVLAVVEGDNSVVGYCYRFLGTFVLDKEASKKANACVWMRKGKRLNVA